MMMVMVTLIFVVMVMLGVDVSKGELQRFQPSTKADGSITALVIGDWGRKGQYNQSLLARQMGLTAEKMDIDFIISTGDNFYPSGLKDVNDEAFYQSCSDIYTSPALNKTWYTGLGNHDYKGDALAQLSPILKAKDNRWFCMKSFILNTDVVEFFFIDTTPFQDKYFTDSEYHDWRGVLPRDKHLSTLLQDLEGALRESHATWKIVIGHHTIKSAGVHGNTHELIQRLLPIIEANSVDLYINGHDHCLQHISSSDSPLQFLTSGAGSMAWRGVYNWPKSNSKEMKFFYDGQGFMSMQITQHQIHINFYDIFGNVLHKWSASKSLFSIM